MSLRWRLVFAVFGGLTAGVMATVLSLLRLARLGGLPVFLSTVGLVASVLLCLAVCWGASRAFRPVPSLDADDAEVLASQTDRKKKIAPGIRSD